MKRAGVFFLTLFVLGGIGYILTLKEESRVATSPQTSKPTSASDEAGRPASDERVQEGMQAPDFELPTLDGRTIKLSALRGRPVLVTFWNTWSPTCADELPALVSFYQTGRPPELEILAVNVTKSESSIDDVKAVAKKHAIPFPVLLDAEVKAQEAYQAVIIPSSFLVDKSGMIHHVFMEPITVEALQKEMQSLTKR